MFLELNTILLVTMTISILISFILLLHSVIYKTYIVNSWLFPTLCALTLEVIYYNTVRVEDFTYGSKGGK